MKSDQKRWDDQKKQIARDTKVTIQAAKDSINDALKKGKEELKELTLSLESTKKQHEIEKNKLLDVIIALKDEKSDLEYDKKILQQTNADLTAVNLELKSEITVHKKDLAVLQEEEKTKSEIITDLKDQEKDLTNTANGLNEYIDKKQAESSEIEDTFIKRKAEIDKDISVLELKKQDLSQEIVENQSKQEKVRDNLAKWAKELDDKDKNLRMREARVNEQEKSIARNYNLLQL